MRPDLSTALSKYLRLGVIAANTVQILGQATSNAGASDDLGQTVLGTTLAHLAEVREGFQMQVKSSTVPSVPEMQYLVDRALVSWAWLEQMNWDLPKTNELELPDLQLLAFAHAYIALAMLPRLPRARVTFPQAHASYADIPVPSNGAELLQRLEELEQVIYHVLGGAQHRLERGPLRRTYGYFESSAWLVNDHKQKFQQGTKK